MDRGMKKWIYWGAYVFLTLAGFLACIFRLLPVVTPSVFLLGLYNLWQGVAWALHLYPYVPQHHSRRRQLLFSAACICLGIVWVPLSLTSWSTQWGPLDRLYPSLFDPRLRLVPLPRLTAPPRLSAVFPLCSDPN